MTVLWWLVSLALVALSALLLLAGIRGKEGVLRIGLPSERPPADASGQPSGQPGDAASESPAGQAEEAEAGGVSTLPIDQGVSGGEGPEAREPGARRMNLPNVIIGAAGLVVGLAALVIFAI